jgi:hypothetical protein
MGEAINRVRDRARERAKLEEAIKARQQATRLVVELAQSEGDTGNVIAFPVALSGRLRRSAARA